MKKLFSLVFLCVVLACNNSSESSRSADSIGTTTTGAENVNGNIPDTNSGIQLNQPLPVDSSKLRDSSRR